MGQLDYYKTERSIFDNIDPDTILIDGLTEHDRIFFLCEFSKLINFYDQSDSLDKSWQPMLLKDPIFTLIYISRHRIKSVNEELYLLSTIIRKAIEKIKGEINTGGPITADIIFHRNDIGIALQQFYRVLLTQFETIISWESQLNLNHITFKFKSFVVDNVKNKFRAEFVELTSNYELLLQSIDKNKEVAENLKKNPASLNFILKKIVESSKNNETWNEGVKKMKEAWDEMTRLSLDLLSFIENVTVQAGKAVVELEQGKSPYPDTVLIRSFLKLLTIHQKEINGLSEKHLNFYYDQILKFAVKKGTPDRAYVCGILSEPSSTYTLRKGTDFFAGIDDNKNDILFKSISQVQLNPATINKVEYLFQDTSDSIEVDSKKGMAVIAEIPEPTEVHIDEYGVVKIWDTLIDETKNTQVDYVQGLIVSSPLLFLGPAEKRIISVTLIVNPELNSNQAGNERLPKNTGFYLSTEEGWFKVELDKTNLCPTSAKEEIAFSITLEASDPAIVAFPEEVDGFYSKWPSLKLEFNTPVKFNLTELKIHNKVTNSQSVELLSDSGTLNKNDSFQPLGVTPLLGSSMYLGSSELFSKKLSAFNFGIKWMLPSTSFGTYYKTYDNYLCSEGIEKTRIYPNQLFPVTFNALDKFNWTEPLVMSKKDSTLYIKKDIGGKECDDCKECEECEGCEKSDECKKCEDDRKGEGFYDEKTIYTYESGLPAPIPDLQIEPLPELAESSTGYIRMKLTGPKYGFGNDLYPQVVSWVALRNSEMLIKEIGDNSEGDKESEARQSSLFGSIFNVVLNPLKSVLGIKDKDKNAAETTIASEKSSIEIDLMQPPNLPYVPTAQSFDSYYEAFEDYTFTKTAVGNSDCYQYNSFNQAYPYGESEGKALLIAEDINHCEDLEGSSDRVNESFGLYVTLENLLTGDLSLYFEIRNSGQKAKGTTIKYYYLSTAGWKGLCLMEDTTFNMESSGVVIVRIPTDLAVDEDGMSKIYIKSKTDNKDEHRIPFESIVYMNTNGFLVERTSTDSFSNGNVTIPAETITSLYQNIGEIQGVTQPFHSFGGIENENKSRMRKRIVSRLNSKDRIVKKLDFYEIIRSEYPEIIHVHVETYKDRIKSSGAKGDKIDRNTVRVFLAENFETTLSPIGYLPYINGPKRKGIQEFLQQKASPFVSVLVENFNPEFLEIEMTITTDLNVEAEKVKFDIRYVMTHYFAPWMPSVNPQRQLGTEVTYAELVDLIESVDGVKSVDDVETVRIDDKVTIGSDKNSNALKNNEIKATCLNSILAVMPSNIIITII